MTLKTDIDSNQTTLLIMNSLEYNDSIINIIKELSGNICYITTNKTYDSLKDTFKKNGVDTENIIFLDSISKSLKKVPTDLKDVYFISSPGALTELSLVVNKFLKHDFDYLVFDSLTNLSIYQKPAMCIKFLADLVNKIKKTETKAIFYALESKEQEEIINKASSLLDNAIKVEK